MELEQPPGDSAVVEQTTTTETHGDAPEIQFDEATGLPLAQQDPEDADIEEEIEGVTLRGKKDAVERAKNERLMQADYTRKTQEVAESRRALESREAQFQQTAQAHQAHIREVAQVVAIDDRLAQFSQVNWAALTDADPVQALKLHTEFTQLQANKEKLVNTLTQRQQQAAQQQQREHARQLMDARTVLQREIKGWSPELAGKLEEFGKTLGFDEQAMSSITNPSIVKLLHKAFMFDQLEKQRTAKAPVAPAPPATRLSGGAASSTKRLSDLSYDEYVASRRNYIKNHR